ncbi:MAG: hypothetical protein N3D84_01065 [Candidatus Woesearchaeota archaeon]|nr:hypothetical protein [Candidatus Woesearchaeota archaeon]
MEKEKMKQKEGITNPVEKFVYDMVESSKRPFDAAKPNECKEDPKEIEKLTEMVKEKAKRMRF